MDIKQYSIYKLKNEVNIFNLLLSISLSNALFGMMLVYFKAPQIIEQLFPNKFSIEASMGVEFLFGVFGFITGAFMPLMSCFISTFIIKLFFLIFKIELNFNDIFYSCLFCYLPYVCFQFFQVLNISLFPNFNIVKNINFPLSHFVHLPVLSNFSIVGLISSVLLIVLLINSIHGKKIQIILILLSLYVSSLLISI